MSPVLGPLAFLPSMTEWIFFLVIGLLLFGKKLPQVLKDAGRQVAELKRSLERLKSQLHEDKDFRELSSAAHDLREAVTTPRRILEQTIHNAVHETRSGVDSLRQQVEGTPEVAQEPPGSGEAFSGLTDETKASPGPDATFAQPPEQSLLEKLRSEPAPPPPREEGV
jgi:Sec-independent protein translocase protein TatA